MKPLCLLAALYFTSCTLFFGGLNAGDRCSPEEFVNNCSNNALHVCESGVIFDIPCGDNGCNPEETSCNDLCGDGAVTGIEECDASSEPKEGEPPQPPCDQFCQRIPVCGDNEVDFPEQCDGVNPDSANDCDSNCKIVPIQEVEPNDDAFLFNREPIITRDTVVQSAGLNPDYFPLQNLSNEPVSVRVDFYLPQTGLRRPCNLDVGGLGFILDDAGLFLLDLPRRPDFCSGGEFILEPSQKVFLATGGEYLVEIDFNRSVVCGDGFVSMSEECEPPGLGACDLFCQRVPVCGDGFVDFPEEICDDGNTINNDGCSDVCRGDLPLDIIDESEPNDDGSPQEGSLDFSAENANGPFTQDVLLRGAFSISGDEDGFLFHNTSASPVDLQVEISKASGGLGGCEFFGSNTIIFSEQGAELVGFIGFSACVPAIVPLAPNQLVFVHLTVPGDIGVTEEYLLSVQFKTPVCGNGRVEAGEQCDLPGDNSGCNPQCRIDGAIDKLPSTQDNPQGPFTQDTIISALFSELSQDFFLVQNNTTEEQLVDVFLSDPEVDLSGAICGNIVDSLALLIVDAANDNPFFLRPILRFSLCGSARFRMAPGQQARIEVSSLFFNQGVNPYTLSIDFISCGNGDVEVDEECDGGPNCDARCQRIAVCGDGLVDAPETCDDSNTSGGDLCSASCQLELSGELEQEPNDDGILNDVGDLLVISFINFDVTPETARGPFIGDHIFVGSINSSGDEDAYLLGNPTNVLTRYRLNLYHPALGIGQSCGFLMNPMFQVYNAEGFQVAQSGDRSDTDRCDELVIDVLPQSTQLIAVQDEIDVLPITGYLLVMEELPSPCGNTVLEQGEECEPPNSATCDGACQRIPSCGDGFVDAPEQCDDSNTIDGDFCSSLCALRAGQAEQEPNEDGTPSPGADQFLGGDFSADNANGPFIVDAVLIAEFAPDGDEDVFAISNTSAQATTVRLDVFNPALGFGAPCGLTTDTVINIRDAAAGVLEQNDDRNGSEDRCSGITVSLAAGETKFAQVISFGDFASFPYLLVIDFEANCGDGQLQAGEECEPPGVGSCDAQCQRVPSCGDGFLDVPEECDDSNAANGDGCSSTCEIEECGDGVAQSLLGEECDDGNNLNNDGCDIDCIRRADLIETEPNDDGSVSLGGLGIDGNDFSSSNANGPFAQDVTIFASLSPAGDEDVFALSNPTGNTITVSVNTFSAASGLGAACEESSDTGINIRDAAGALLAQNDDRAVQDSCSGVSFSLPPGETVFAHITEFKDNGAISGYFLVVDLP